MLRVLKSPTTIGGPPIGVPDDVYTYCQHGSNTLRTMWQKVTLLYVTTLHITARKQTYSLNQLRGARTHKSEIKCLML